MNDVPSGYGRRPRGVVEGPDETEEVQPWVGRPQRRHTPDSNFESETPTRGKFFVLYVEETGQRILGGRVEEP